MNNAVVPVRRRGRRRSEAERDESVQQRILLAAIGLTWRSGFAAVTCANLADSLHIRSHSLLKLIDSVDTVRDKVALLALQDLIDFTHAAVQDRTGRDAVRALVDAQRLFAQAQPGMYEASQSALSSTSTEAYPIIDALRTIESDVMKSYGASPRQSSELAWCMRAMVRGAINLEASDKRIRPDEVDQRFDQLIDILDSGAKLAAALCSRAHSEVA
jgi:hypothetical protein